MRPRASAMYLVGFWVIQVAAGLCFKQGGTDPENRLAYFVVGNAFGISSTWLLIKLYERMNANLALALGAAGAFLGCQIAMAVLFRTGLTLIQWAGILTIVAGTVVAVLGGESPVKPVGAETPARSDAP